MSEDPLTPEDRARIDEMLRNFSDEHARCPFCGFEHDPADDAWDLLDEDTTEWDCDSCDRRFNVSVAVSHSWQTEKPE